MRKSNLRLKKNYANRFGRFPAKSQNLSCFINTGIIVISYLYGSLIFFMFK